MKKNNELLISNLTLALKMITALYKKGTINEPTFHAIMKKYCGMANA